MSVSWSGPQQAGDGVQDGVQALEAGQILVAEDGWEEPGQVPQHVDFSSDCCLSERRDHDLALSPHLAPDHGEPHLGLAPGGLAGGQEGEEGRRETGGEGGVGVGGGVDRDPGPGQEVEEGGDGEGRVRGRAPHHDVLSPADQCGLDLEHSTQGQVRVTQC